MSYDLFFIGRKFTGADFTGYFSSRPNYKTEGPHAVYENEDTGVYFTFDLRSDDDKKSDPESMDSDVAFNINFFRPHIFGLEAEPEVKAFVDKFALSVEDPQSNGMGREPYSSSGFLSGWNHGNEFGIKAILSDKRQDPAAISTYPAAALEKIWKWNFNRSATQRELGDGIFVPRIMFVREGAEVFACAVWGDAVPSLLPQVDRLIVPRKELAPKMYMIFEGKPDRCFIDYAKMKQTFGRYLVNDYALPALMLPHPDPVPETIAFVRQLPASDAKLTGLSMDKVLDHELVEASKPK
jgi:hypothetical protein